MILIEPWKEKYKNQLLPMIRGYLSDQMGRGNDVMLTPKNVAWFWRVGMDLSKAGEPTLLAREGEKVLSFILAGPVVSELDLRYKSLQIFGGYTLPSRRGEMLQVMILREIALRARDLGYQRGETLVFLRDWGTVERAFTGDIWPVSVTVQWFTPLLEHDTGKEKTKKVSL